MASVAQSVEHWSRDPGLRVRFPAGGLEVAFFAAGPVWVLKCISFWRTNLPYFKKYLIGKTFPMQLSVESCVGNVEIQVENVKMLVYCRNTHKSRLTLRTKGQRQR